MSHSKEAIAAVCLDLLGQAPDSISAPGGESRDSLRARFGEQSLIVTHRRHLQRARLEALVLRTLNEARAPVPRLIAWRESWLMQQDVGKRRLTEVLDSCDEPEVEDWLDKAAAALLHCHRAGADAGLQLQLVSLGEKLPWFDKLFSRRLSVAEHLGLQAPDLPEAELRQLLRLREPHFIKWDARPGNAVVNEGGDLFWIDWEHAGCRNSLDDLVWLLADEFSPASADAEQRLLDTWIAGFSPGWSRQEAFDYFYSYAILHSLVRLDYILRHKGNGDWWEHAHCLRLDKVGVTRAHALRLCCRMRRWSTRSSPLAGLGDWLGLVETQIQAS